MDFKVVIKCERCKCAFELRPGNFVGRETLSCPNCSQEFDQSVLDHLEKGLFEFAQVPQTIPEDADMFGIVLGKKPRFSIDVKEYFPLETD